MSVRFTQSCPTCGRRTQIRAVLLGSNVACQHCQAEFIASDKGTLADPVDSELNLMARVERALKLVDDRTVV